MMKEIVYNKLLSTLDVDTVFGNDSIINMKFVAEGYVFLERLLYIKSGKEVFLPVMSSYLSKLDNCDGVLYVSDDSGMIR